MEQRDYYVCSVCGDVSSTPDSWFLALRDHAPDKLLILRWNARLGSEESAQLACCDAHVQALAVLWMATGDVNWPSSRRGQRMNATNLLTWYEVDLTDSVLVGELTVDRESLRRVLINNPGALRYVLDSLQSPFNADTERDRATAECCTALVV